jgi:dTDP-4-dehydrorhamnose 3,5-epimerase-like enzyme
VSLIELISLELLGDERGQLAVCEAMRNIPFEIKRLYYLTGTKLDVSRGFHAHKELYQVAVSVSGKCLMVLDNGIKKEEVWLDSPDKAVRINSMIWHEMHHFSADCVLLVIASEYYDENDYIRNYNDFLEALNRG